MKQFRNLFILISILSSIVINKIADIAWFSLFWIMGGIIGPGTAGTVFTPANEKAIKAAVKANESIGAMVYVAPGVMKWENTLVIPNFIHLVFAGSQASRIK